MRVGCPGLLASYRSRAREQFSLQKVMSRQFYSRSVGTIFQPPQQPLIICSLLLCVCGSLGLVDFWCLGAFISVIVIPSICIVTLIKAMYAWLYAWLYDSKYIDLSIQAQINAQYRNNVETISLSTWTYLLMSLFIVLDIGSASVDVPIPCKPYVYAVIHYRMSLVCMVCRRKGVVTSLRERGLSVSQCQEGLIWTLLARYACHNI